MARRLTSEALKVFGSVPQKTQITEVLRHSYQVIMQNLIRVSLTVHAFGHLLQVICKLLCNPPPPQLFFFF